MAALVLLILLLIPMGRVLAGLFSAHVSHRDAASPVSGTSLPGQMPTPTPASLTKEYIYAGGQLVATEEPTGGGSSTLSAPATLIASGASGPQVYVSWAASTGGNVDHYQVERSQNISSGFTVVSSNLTGISFNDTTVTPGMAYLYRVRALDASGNASPYSNLDYATAMVFQPIVAHSTTIKAQDFNDLRDAVNAVRALANLQPFNWTAPAPVHNGPIKATHIQQLRSNIDQALQALSGQQIGSATSYLSQAYTDPTINSTTSTPVRKVHLTEVRDRVRGYQLP